MTTYNIYQALRDYMEQHNQPTLADICDGIEKAPGTVAPVLRVLVRNSTVTKTGRGPEATFHHKAYDDNQSNVSETICEACGDEFYLKPGDEWVCATCGGKLVTGA